MQAYKGFPAAPKAIKSLCSLLALLFYAEGLELLQSRCQPCCCSLGVRAVGLCLVQEFFLSRDAVCAAEYTR